MTCLIELASPAANGKEVNLKENFLMFTLRGCYCCILHSSLDHKMAKITYLLKNKKHRKNRNVQINYNLPDIAYKEIKLRSFSKQWLQLVSQPNLWKIRGTKHTSIAVTRLDFQRLQPCTPFIHFTSIFFNKCTMLKKIELN